MKIAITGASGFIGLELIQALLEREDIRILALSRSERSGEDCDRVAWRQTDYTVESLEAALKDAEAVVHLAAVRGTAGCYADYNVNEMITENLLLAAGACGLKRVVFASSIAVYSDLEKIPWTEDMPLSPKTLYGITKASCEYLCQYYSRKYGFDPVIVRIAQVLGRGEKRRVMTNVFMDQAAGRKELCVMGESRARRQYIYSRDLAEILSAFACGDHGPLTVNVGMEKPVSNLEVARLTNRAFGNPVPIRYDDSVKETIEPSHMNTDRLRGLLDYRPMEMEEALGQIAEEYEQG